MTTTNNMTARAVAANFQFLSQELPVGTAGGTTEVELDSRRRRTEPAHQDESPPSPLRRWTCSAATRAASATISVSLEVGA